MKNILVQFRKWYLKLQAKRCKNARQGYSGLLEVCGRETLPYRTVARWANAFPRGREDFNLKRGAGRPQTASDDVHANAVRALLQEHRCWTCIELARQVGIVPGTFLHILKKKLKVRKICARWISHNFKGENMW